MFRGLYSASSRSVWYSDSTQSAPTQEGYSCPRRSSVYWSFASLPPSFKFHYQDPSLSELSGTPSHYRRCSKCPPPNIMERMFPCMIPLGSCHHKDVSASSTSMERPGGIWGRFKNIWTRDNATPTPLSSSSSKPSANPSTDSSPSSQPHSPQPEEISPQPEEHSSQPEERSPQPVEKPGTPEPRSKPWSVRRLLLTANLGVVMLIALYVWTL